MWCLLLFADLFTWGCCFESGCCFCLFVIAVFGLVVLQCVDIVVLFWLWLFMFRIWDRLCGVYLFNSVVYRFGGVLTGCFCCLLLDLCCMVVCLFVLLCCLWVLFGCWYCFLYVIVLISSFDCFYMCL